MASDVPAKLVKSQVDGSGVVDFDTDTFLGVLVVAGSGAPGCSKSGVQFLSDVLSGNAEVTGSNYARITITGLTLAFNAGSDVVEWSFNSTVLTWLQHASGFSNARYLILVKDGASDAARRVVEVCDLISDRGNVGGDLVLSPPSNGLINWSPP